MGQKVKAKLRKFEFVAKEGGGELVPLGQV